MEAAGLLWISSLRLSPRAGPSNQWPSAKNAGQLPFLLSPLSGLRSHHHHCPGGADSPSQLLEKPFLVTAQGADLTLLGSLDPSTHQSTGTC